MAYRLDPATSTQVEVRRVADEQLGKALAMLEGLRRAGPDEIELAVHEVRKRCKETRGLARLVRPALGDEFAPFNHTMRDAANELSSIRDAHALLATFDNLRETTNRCDDVRLDRVRSGQAAAAEAATRAIRDGDPRIREARRLLATARSRVERWELPDGFAPLGDGLARTYRRGRRGLKQAAHDPTDDRMHEWRKAVKNLWYQVRLLGRSAPSLLGPLTDRLDDLAEALGDDHDLAVLIERLETEPARFGGRRASTEAINLARAAQQELRIRAFRLGATIYAEPTAAFVARIQAYWDHAHELGPEPKTRSVKALPDGFAALGADLARAYRHGRKGLGRVRHTPTETTIRSWQLSVDALAAQVRLLDPIAPSVLAPLVVRLDELSDTLARDRRLGKRLDQLHATSKNGGKKHRKAAEKKVQTAGKKQAKARHRALRLGATIYAEPTAAFVSRIERYWDQAIELGPEQQAGGLSQLAPTPSNS